MGIAISNEDTGGLDASSSAKNSLRLNVSTVSDIVHGFYSFQFSPIIGLTELHSLLSTSVSKKAESMPKIVNIVWTYYAQDNVCFATDVLCALVLLAEADWTSRLGLLFELFKTTGIDEMRYPDFILLVHSAIKALERLWESSVIDDAERIAESVANSAFQKMNKSIDQGFSKTEFVHWCSARFRESKTVSTAAVLHRVLSSEYADT